MDKQKNRRRFAWVAFIAIVGTLIALLVFIGTGDDDTRQNVQAFQGMGMLILTCLTGLIAQYSEHSRRQDETNDKNQ